MGGMALLAAELRVRSRFSIARGLAILCIFASTTRVEAYQHHPPCPTGFANFGDSLTDTGNTLDTFPYITSNVESLPYGETYFGKPAKRWSNGRVVVDFFSLAFHYPLLDPYFKVTTYHYKNGINFAQAGATSIPRITAANPFSVIPFQLNQFRRFAGSVAETQQNAVNCGTFLPLLPTGSLYLNDWLYTIEIGGNDILPTTNFSSPESIQSAINTTVPEIVGAIALAIQTLYGEGARNFLVFGIPTTETANGEQILEAFNIQILATIGGLRTMLNGSYIAYFDYFAAYHEINNHPAKYGFKYLYPNICCGTYALGSFNFTTATCGVEGVQSCANPDEYIIWDGIHFTEAFYRVISSFALTGQFTDGGVNYAEQCKLDFSEFGSDATYQRDYPTECDSIFA